MIRIHLICILAFISSNAQILHHQTIASQGKSKLTSSGYYINQSIGQQSIGGSFKNSSKVVHQGFQHFSGNYFLLDFNFNYNLNLVKVYPNPFVSFLNLEFLNDVNEKVEVTFFDLTGKLVHTVNQNPINSILLIELGFLQEGQYILKVNSSSSIFSTIIIKSN
jgi:hypothetical protein